MNTETKHTSKYIDANGELVIVADGPYCLYCGQRRGAQLQRDKLAEALVPIARSCLDDPGVSDLDNEQPVIITLGDVRRIRAALSMIRG